MDVPSPHLRNRTFLFWALQSHHGPSPNLPLPPLPTLCYCSEVDPDELQGPYRWAKDYVHDLPKKVRGGREAGPN
jgi:hypothetical protein